MHFALGVIEFPQATVARVAEQSGPTATGDLLHIARCQPLDAAAIRVRDNPTIREYPRAGYLRLFRGRVVVRPHAASVAHPLKVCNFSAFGPVGVGSSLAPPLERNQNGGQ